MVSKIKFNTSYLLSGQVLKTLLTSPKASFSVPFPSLVQWAFESMFRPVNKGNRLSINFEKMLIIYAYVVITSQWNIFETFLLNRFH